MSLAVLTGEAGNVTTVEIDEELARVARVKLETAGFASRVRVVAADGRFSYAPAAPYDRIIITAGVAALRPELVAQLRPGTGRIVAPIETAGGFSLLFVGARPAEEGDEVALAGRFQGLPLAFVPLRGPSWVEAEEPWQKLAAAEGQYRQQRWRLDPLLERSRHMGDWTMDKEVAALLLLALAVEAAATDPSRDPQRMVQALWFDRDRPGIGELRFAFRTPSPADGHGLAVMRGAYLFVLEG